MGLDRTPATAAQAKALGSPIRLRILRLCLYEELTNQQLAQRLDVDPSTLLYHARILVENGFLERADQRHGPTGALEKPYRATGLSWSLDLGADRSVATQAMLGAVEAELAEAGADSVESASRFVLHLSPETREEMMDRIKEILNEYDLTDDERRSEGQPRLGGLFVLHQLADPD